MKKVAMLVLAGIFFAFAVVSAQSPKKPGEVVTPLAPGKIRITPVELFPGDRKQLQPHLRMSGACFKVEYNGEEMEARVFLETWENGKRQGYSYQRCSLRKGTTCQASITITDGFRDDDGNPASRVTSVVTEKSDEGSSEGSTSQLETQRKGLTTGRRSAKAADFSKDNEIYLWATVGVKKGKGIELDSPLDDLVKNSDQAIVLKLIPGGDE
jgi:hypothetical protein